MAEPHVWDEPEKAQALGRERSSLESVVKTIETLDRGLADSRDLIDMAVEENDEGSISDIEADIDLVGTEDDTVFAYQIAAGGSLAVNDRLSIDVQYRYFATEDPNFDGLKAEYATHNLFFGLRFNF